MKPDLADVLAEVNRLRAERDLPPLDEMPKGERFASFSCPLAHAVEGQVGPMFMWPFGARDSMGTPSLFYAFARAFDKGEYPELIADA